MITERRARCLAQMDEHGIDVLVLGREANVRFASGARRLWTAGTRPFSRSLLTSGEKAESPLMITKVSTCDFV